MLKTIDISKYKSLSDAVTSLRIAEEEYNKALETVEREVNKLHSAKVVSDLLGPASHKEEKKVDSSLPKQDPYQGLNPQQRKIVDFIEGNTWCSARKIATCCDVSFDKITRILRTMGRKGVIANYYAKGNPNHNGTAKNRTFLYWISAVKK